MLLKAFSNMVCGPCTLAGSYIGSHFASKHDGSVIVAAETTHDTKTDWLTGLPDLRHRRLPAAWCEPINLAPNDASQE